MKKLKEKNRRDIIGLFFAKKSLFDRLAEAAFNAKALFYFPFTVRPPAVRLWVELRSSLFKSTMRRGISRELV